MSADNQTCARGGPGGACDVCSVGGCKVPGNRGRQAQLNDWLHSEYAEHGVSVPADQAERLKVFLQAYANEAYARGYNQAASEAANEIARLEELLRDNGLSFGSGCVGEPQ